MHIDRKLPDIIRAARGQQSQADFAKKIKKTQSLVSKYERGVASPPKAVVEYCLRKVLPTDSVVSPCDSSALAEKLKTEFSGPKFDSFREYLGSLLDAASEQH